MFESILIDTYGTFYSHVVVPVEGHGVLFGLIERTFVFFAYQCYHYSSREEVAVPADWYIQKDEWL
jgi:hypothetical protein